MCKNLIEPGKNRDNYWTNADLIKQLQEKVYYALNATSLNLKGGGKNVSLMRNGWFFKDQEKIIQPMQFSDQPQIQKGICTILEERKLW
ncbi:6973_t:CDS:2 [Diversispora eburnea]|uniref:6973_t:CDS:1 n=1 Tax=Diversispora eburnea TaxID=1213867 RepID=A0A9N8YNE4_9GLOM|nr:6973_t:CDS:2 [Diversispora eburnea]